MRNYNISPSEAYDRWYRAIAKKDDRIAEILDNFIHANSEGLPVLINRNPTINYGSIIINKKNVLNLSEDELSKIRLNEIGIVFQEYNLLQFMTALENVMVPLLLDRNLTILESTIRAKKMLEYVGLNNRIDHYTKELSGGEQQRVAIARALINNPNIILADEPTGNLDNKNKKIVLELLKKVSNEGKCVIMTTHDLEVLKYADEVYSLVDGKLVPYEY